MTRARRRLVMGCCAITGRLAAPPAALFAAVLFVAVLFAAAPASAACHVGKLLEVPVTMVDNRPLVTARINGRPARLMLDSGAFFSTIAQANAAEYALKVQNMPGARMKGVGGDSSLGVARVKEFTLGGYPFTNVEFAVGGSDTGFAGLLGQNILGVADVEYDLPHGMVRIMKSDGCARADLAYWAAGKPFVIVPLKPMSATQRHTIGTVRIDGKDVDALFDSGAGDALMTSATARRLGVTPDTPGVVRKGYAFGLGTASTPTWQARFGAIDIGGEKIARPLIGFSDQRFADADMLIGIDFFLSHRIYVDNRNHRMFVTYEGGPVFGLNPKGVSDAGGKPLDLTDREGAPTDAAGYSRRGAVLASRGKFAEAVADFDKAAAMAPENASFVYQRALAEHGAGHEAPARRDLDKAVSLAPANAEYRLMRASVLLGAGDRAGAAADLKAADAVLAPSSDMRLRLAQLYDAADMPEAAIGGYDQWLSAHPADHDRPGALNGRCWARGLLARDLSGALDDCNAALKARPGVPAYLDSRALVWLRRGEDKKALADYNAALTTAPHSAWSLYARGIVERRMGNAAAADKDQAAATAIDAKVAERARRYGVGRWGGCRINLN